MNENRSDPAALAQLEGLARRLEADPAYMAWALREYQKRERLDADQLAEQLESDAPMLVRLALCKRPDSSSERFAAQVRELAEYVGVNVAVLANLLRQVDSLAALRARPAPALEPGAKPAPLVHRPMFGSEARPAFLMRAVLDTPMPASAPAEHYNVRAEQSDAPAEQEVSDMDADRDAPAEPDEADAAGESLAGDS